MLQKRNNEIILTYTSIGEVYNNDSMNEEVKAFLSRLKTVKNKACDERITVKTVHDRAKKGIYNIIEIDGVKFVLEDKED